MESLLSDLTCPITLELLEDPISVPCCGKAFSRESLNLHAAVSKRCPCCNGDLSSFDPHTAVKNVVISGMIDSLNNPRTEAKPHTWSCEFTPIADNERMGELKLMLEDSNFATRPSLFIAVLDRSGSMSGRPGEQVLTSLKHIESLAAINDQVKLVMLSYGSDCTEIENATDYKISGGTNFRAAFQSVDKVLRRFVCSDDPKDKNALNNISSVTIAFLTDGEDGSGDRNRLVPEFHEMLQTRWGDHPLTVHTIGFGRTCDRNLLEGMREAGSLPGMFRYAEQEDDDDLLCSKLTGIFETSSKASCVSLTLKVGETEESIQFPINSRQFGEFSKWIELPDSMSSISVSSYIENETLIDIIKKKSSPLVMDRWISKCVDSLASKLLAINANTTTDRIRHLQSAMLQIEIDALYARSSEEATHIRLDFLTAQNRLLRAGKALHAGKLSDMRFSSAFSEKPTTTKVCSVAPKTETKTLADKPFFESPLLRYGHSNIGKNRNELQELIMNHYSDTIPEEIEKQISAASPDIISYKDCHGNNALMLASYSGLSKITKRILEKHPQVDLEETNNFGETALTLAIKRRGFHHTLGVLLDAGAQLIRKASLERYAIDNGFTITAEIISNSSSGALFVDCSMTEKYIRYVFGKIVDKGNFDVEKFLNVCLAKLMHAEVEILLTKFDATPSIDMLLDHCMPKKPDAKDTEEYLQLAKMLITKDSSLIDAQQTDSGDTPLITAVRKGSLPHVQYFISVGATIEKTNFKGNSPLWVASFMRYPCIITELINHGADVNKENLKGNPPLYGPCCRGTPKVAEQLISQGADVFATNTNGDTMILICCRNGQYETLECLLDYVDEEFVNFKAHIDGFNAIMACAEQNRAQCIRVLHKYGINIDQTTAPDNAILAGATPLHISCYYGRVQAASVLLELGANANAKDAGGNTPLHLAVMQGFIEIIKVLRHKSDLSIVNSNGNPAMAYCRDREEIRAELVNPMLDILMCLAKGGFSKDDEANAIRLLKEFKDIPGCLTTKDIVDVFDHDGSTPLQQATICGNYNLVSALLACNADPRIPNSFEVNSIVLAQWIRNRRILQLFNCSDCDLASPQFERLTKMSKNSPHYAPVLFLGRKPNEYQVFKNSGISQRMESFLNTPVFVVKEKTDFLTIESSKTQIQNYFQSKDSGLEEIGKSVLFWESKAFVINKVAAGEELLNPTELLGLSMFVNNSRVPQILNSALLHLEPEKQIICDYNNLLFSTLSKLPLFNAECFIGSSCVDRKLFLKGTEFNWQHFVSCSVMWKVALENTPSFTTKTHKGVIFIVRSKTGRLVQDYSPFPSDVEVLILPGTRFRVTNWYHGDVIALGQENIREHTFGVKDIDDERLTYSELQENEKAVIIEISEI